MDNYWKEKSNDYSLVVSNAYAINNILHPNVIKRIKPKSHVLELGCGDGSLAAKIVDFVDINISLFDESNSLIELAKQKLDRKSKKAIYYSKLSEVPNHHFELITISLVLMNLSSKSETEALLKSAISKLKTDGKIVITIMHPCFRDERYSYVQTTYKNDVSNYFDEWKQFKVKLHSSKKNPPKKYETVFNNFHFTLTSLFQIAFSCELEIVGFEELMDHDPNMKFNQSKPIYIVAEFVRKVSKKTS